MNDLEILKQVGIKDVSKKTHIEPEFLQYILDRNYEKLIRVNVNGYLKILQREYGLDLSEWAAEYSSYCQENQIDDSLKTIVNPKIPAYTAASATNTQTTNNGSLKWIGLFILIIIAIFIAGYFGGANKYLNQLPSIFEDENRSTTYSNASIVEEVQGNITISQNNQDLNFSNQSLDTNTTFSIITTNDKNSTKDSLEKITKEMDKNISNEKNQTQKKEQGNLTQNLKYDLNTSKAQSSKINMENKDGSKSNKENKIAYIIPNSKVWIGAINLSNYKKSSITTSKKFTIDLKKDQLISCGNANFKLYVDGEVIKFDNQKSIKLLVKDSNIEQISYDKFLSLNKGRSW